MNEENKKTIQGKLTPEKAAKYLNEHGFHVSPEQAAEVTTFLQKIAKMAIATVKKS